MSLVLAGPSNPRAGPFPLGKQTQRRTDGRRSRSCLWSLSFFFSCRVLCFSYDFSNSLSNWEQVQWGRIPSCPCKAPVFVLCQFQFPVSFSDNFPVSAVKQNHSAAARLLNCTLAPSRIGTKENNSSLTPTAASAESSNVWGKGATPLYLANRMNSLRDLSVLEKSKPTSEEELKPLPGSFVCCVLV